MDKKNRSNNKTISWDETGQSFIIKSRERLQKELNTHFKKIKIDSFLRQLSFYRFERSKSEKGKPLFHNEHFKKGGKKILSLIKRERKIKKTKTREIDFSKINNFLKNYKEVVENSFCSFEDEKNKFELFEFLGAYNNFYGKGIKSFFNNLKRLLEEKHFELYDSLKNKLTDLLKIFELNKMKGIQKLSFTQHANDIINSIVDYFERSPSEVCDLEIPDFHFFQKGNNFSSKGMKQHKLFSDCFDHAGKIERIEKSISVGMEKEMNDSELFSFSLLSPMKIEEE